MAYQYYITPENYLQAESNGIKKTTLEYRVRNLAWDTHRAITTPPKKRICTGDKWRELARKNGIPYQAFQKRVNVYGWEHERAATEGLQNRHENIKKVIAKQKRYQKVEVMT